MATKGLTPEVFARWLLPNTALNRVSKVIVGMPASRAILERLKAGFIKAAARKTAIRGALGGTTHSGLAEIPNEHWEGLQSEEFWNSGDAHFDLRHGHGLMLEAIAARCVGIKIDPAGIRELIATLPKKSLRKKAPPVSPPPADPIQVEKLGQTEEVTKGPPVSSADLRAWFVAYRTAYKGSDDTLANAYRSASGMFPDKFVSRDRVRALCAGRKRGRKELPEP